MRKKIKTRLNALARNWSVAEVGAQRDDYDLNPSARPKPGAVRQLKSAAVLVPIIDYPHGLHILLTRRAMHLNSHPGQISFPGGQREQADASPIETALRETEEEVGLAAHHVEPIGTLDIYETGTGYRIVPVVGIVRPGFTLAIDALEVAEVFEVPLEFVIDARNHVRRSGVMRGVMRHYYAIPFNEYNIWGATASMLVDLSEKLGE